MRILGGSTTKMQKAARESSKDARNVRRSRVINHPVSCCSRGRTFDLVEIEEALARWSDTKET